MFQLATLETAVVTRPMKFEVLYYDAFSVLVT